MTHPSQLVSQARDGYIAARVAELGNGFRRTGRSISTTCIHVRVRRVRGDLTDCRAREQEFS